MKKIILALSIIIFALGAKAQTVMKKDFEINGTTGQLHTILQYPAEVENDVSYPLVIICHGFNGNSNEPLLETLAEDLLQEGIAVLRFDFNGHGKSEGKFQDMTVGKEIDDLMCVIAWARSQPWVDSVSLVGHSQGGVVVSMAAGELGDSAIKSEVLLAPAAVLRDDALRGTTMGAFYDPYNISGDYVELPFGGLLLGKDYIQEAMQLPIYETASKYNGPALILNGTHDRVVPYTYAIRYDNVLSNSELKLIEGDDHGFSMNMTQTCRLVAKWLKQILQPSPVNPVRI